MEIRNAVPGDERILAYVQTESWKAAFGHILPGEILEKLTGRQRTEEMYARVLQNPNMHIAIGFLGEQPHIISAWSRNRSDLGEETAELVCIHSLPDGWRRGCGSAMMERVLAEITDAGYREVILWVFRENHRARTFYEKLGFVLTDAAQDAFGAEEVMYRKVLRA